MTAWEEKNGNVLILSKVYNVKKIHRVGEIPEVYGIITSWLNKLCAVVAFVVLLPLLLY